jgi:hypothetical protein
MKLPGLTIKTLQATIIALSAVGGVCLGFAVVNDHHAVLRPIAFVVGGALTGFSLGLNIGGEVAIRGVVDRLDDILGPGPAKEEPTPLRKRLNAHAKEYQPLYSVVSVLVGVLAFVVGVVLTVLIR